MTNTKNCSFTKTKDLVEAFDGVVVTTYPDERKVAIKVEADRKKHTHEWTISIQYQVRIYKDSMSNHYC